MNKTLMVLESLDVLNITIFCKIFSRYIEDWYFSQAVVVHRYPGLQRNALDILLWNLVEPTKYLCVCS